MRRLIVAAVAIGCLGALVSGVASSATPNLDRIVLRASQVGPGYRLVTRPDSRCVQGCVTLDLCSSRFPSERLRVARLQVDYVRNGKPGLSNEVVRYRPGGARQALREVTEAAVHCPIGPVASPVGGVATVAYQLHRLVDARLLPGYLAVRVHLTATVNGRQRHADAVGVYQFENSVFSGIYTNGRGTIADQQRLALHAAEESAVNLGREA